jgi:hypothetical protein
MNVLICRWSRVRARVSTCGLIQPSCWGLFTGRAEMSALGLAFPTPTW